MSTPAPLDHAMLLQWCFGAIVVVLYARDRFDKPESARSTTTRTRYWSARLGYILSMLVLFLVLGGAAADLNLQWLWELLRVQADLKNSERLPGPLLSALVLTSMLPHVEFLSRIDETVKKWFQRVGNIPFEVRLLGSQLHATPICPPRAALDRARPKLLELGVTPDWLQEPPDSLRHKWARVATLWTLVDGWKSMRGYSRYLIHQKRAFEEIQSRFETLSALLGDAQFWDAGVPADTPATTALRKKVTKDVNHLDQSICDFISGGVLDREWNLAQRNAMLATFGFDLPAGSAAGLGLTVHEVFLVSGLIFLAMTLIALISRRFLDPNPLPPNLRVLVMVPIIYAVAIIAAIYPKAMWSFANIRQVGHRPVAAYALSGLAAAVAGLFIAVLFRFLFEGSGNLLVALSEPGRFKQAVVITMERWPWQLMTMLATFAIAWMADNPAPGAGKVSHRQRAVEAVGMAACLFVFQWVTIELLATFTSPGSAWYDRARDLLLTSLVVGACIGYFVPHLYRAKLAKVQSSEPLSGSVSTA